MATSNLKGLLKNECVSAFIRINGDKPVTFDFFICQLNNFLHWIKEVDPTIYSRADKTNQLMLNYIISDLKYILLPTTSVKILEEYKKLDKVFYLANIDGYDNVSYPSDYTLKNNELITRYNKYVDDLYSVYNHIHICIRDLNSLEDTAFDFGKGTEKFREFINYEGFARSYYPTRDFSGYSISLLNKNGGVLETKTSPKSGICLFEIPSDFEDLGIRVSKGGEINVYSKTGLDINNKIAIVYINFAGDFIF